MKWYEVIEDLGDGTAEVRRFRTKREAIKYCNQESGPGVYPYSEIEEVDTADKFFFWEE